MGSKDEIREFFERNVGKIVTTQQIRKVADVSEYARRIRELREQEGMQIKTRNDRTDLKPGEYILETLDRLPGFGHGISPQLRNEILERNGYTCQLCGAGANDPDPIFPSRKVRLHIDHILPLAQGGTEDGNNLRVLCSTCNQTKSNIHAVSEPAKNLLARIRKSPQSVQKEVYEALKKKFG